MRDDRPAPEGIRLALLVALTIGAISCSLFYNGSIHHLYAVAGAASILTLAVALHGHSGGAVKPGWPGCGLIALFVWSALALTWSQVPYVSVIELGSLGSGVAIYLAARLADRDDYPFAIDRFLIALGVSIAVVMVIQSGLGFSPDAPFRNPNSAAALLNLIWPIAAVAWLRPDTSRVAGGVSLCIVTLLLIAIGVTGSRGAVLACLAALALIAGVGYFVLRRPAPVLALVLASVSALVISNGVGQGELATGAESMTDPGSAGASRFVIWEAAWEMIRTHPWLGYGPGVFFLAYPAFRSPQDRSGGFFVHNDYLEFWLERGLPGALLFTAILLACAWLVFRVLAGRRLGAPEQSTPLSQLPAAAAICSLGVHGLFSYHLQLMPFLILFGLKIAELERSSAHIPGRAPRIRVPRIRGRPFPLTILVAAVAFGIWQLAVPAVYFSKVDTASRLSARGEYARAADEFAQARALWPLPDSAWFLQANTHYSALRQHGGQLDPRHRQLVTRASELLDRAAARNPHRPGIPLIRGLFRANYPDFTTGSAEASFREALRIDPRTIEARYSLSQILENQDRPDAAAELIREGLQLHYAPGVDISPLERRMRELDG